ncbi:MAG TPA: porin [Usitatibacter sp.]|nr:porin [Usitatibacter sp.]
MNKKLIALAVAGACVAPAAMAQTANPVTLYGRVYVTFENVEAKDGAAPISRRNRVTDNASLLGVRGTEDLGGGLKAFFQLETGFNPAQVQATYATRNSGVGLQGPWGSVLIGRWDVPIKSTSLVVDPYGDLTIGGFTAGMQGSGVFAAQQGQFDRRDPSVVQYWSPEFAGFAVRASYMANSGKTATLNPRSNGASVTYTGGPVYVGYAYHELKDMAFGPFTLNKQTSNAVFGSFIFGPIKVGAMYQENKRDTFTKQKAWMGNVTYTMGNNQFIYQYTNAKDGAINGSLFVQPDCKVNALGYQYNFTRRTFFIGQYAKVENNATATCNLGNAVAGIAPDQDPRGVSVGLRHIF